MKRLVLLLGLAVFAVGVWVMVSSGGGDAVPVGLAPGDEVTSETSGIAVGLRFGDKEEAIEVADADLERGIVEAAEATAPGRRFLRVLVTNNETGDPVPGAIVSWYENFVTNTLEPSELEEYRSISSDREKLTSRYGTDLVADDLGLVIIPVEQYVRTTGRHGDLYGELNIRPNSETEADEEYELELERDLTLRVRVVDSKSRR